MILITINFSLNRIIGFKIIKTSYVSRNRLILSTFKGLSLKENVEEGYFFVEPMPSENDLSPNGIVIRALGKIYYSHSYQK